MKKLLIALLVATSLLLSRSFARDEKTALEEFKKDVAAMKTWADEKEKTFGTDPLAKLHAIGEMVEKIKGINTDGLPADLKDAWTAVLGNFTQVATLAATLPNDPAEVQKKLADPETQKAFGTQMMTIQKDMVPNMAKLKAAADKYGIEGLGKIGGGK